MSQNMVEEKEQNRSQGQKENQAMPAELTQDKSQSGGQVGGDSDITAGLGEEFQLNHAKRIL